ncbi:GNAT family N-acetyltransferase [Streptomyces sp. NBC_00670]|uniref:GNAT family N-acetyltransferase n=1 Tax=Streptomyces sp. NBC_00670 TaxID=2975804 RepID=UPI002E380ABA|nr:GNAT family N-acetyltransferase [Streptomyces sp. NBC_00670]
MKHVIRPIRTDEWPAVKRLRLEALQDPLAHLAFLETYENAVARPDAYWQERTSTAAEGTLERQQFIAEGPDGEWDGSVTVMVEAAGTEDFLGQVVERDQGHLVGVFVRPEQRGSGLAGALFDAALDWSWGLGLHRVRLFVHEDNGRAEAFYRKAGFVPTGVTGPVPGDTGHREREFVMRRSASGAYTGS